MSVEVAMSNPFAHFLNVIRAGGPVLIQVGMTDPSHGNTRDPIEQFSPLVRLSLAAVDLGATNLVFSPEDEFAAILGDVHTAAHTLESLVPEERVSAQVDPAEIPAGRTEDGEGFVGEDANEGGTGANSLATTDEPEDTKDECPGLFLHWCSLNGAFFPHAASVGRKVEEIQSWPEDLPFPMGASFDPSKLGHQKALAQIRALFLEKSRNYAQAAERIQGVLLG